MKRSLILSFFVLISLAFNAQDDKDKEEKVVNLIVNPSFESDNGKIKKLGYAGKSLTGWTTATKTKVDVFTPSSIEPSAGVPFNDRGKANAKDGDNYIGLKIYDYNAKGGRSYLKSQLVESLKKDKRYCLSYSISLADVSKYASNNLGFYFTKKEIYEEKDVLLFDNAIVPMNNLVQENMTSWENICVPFTAKGFEKYVILGNFASASRTATSVMKKPKSISQAQEAMAYYYVDNLKLIEISRDSECICKEEKLVEGPKIIYSKQSVLQENAGYTTRIKSTSVYFYSMKTDLVSASKKELDKLAAVLIAKPKVAITIVGNSDVTEELKLKQADEYVNISEQRADAVKAYLIEKGVSEDQLSIRNNKAKSPASKMKTPISLAKNRRVDFELK